MDIADFISKDSVLVGLRANSKKQLLTELAEKAARALNLDDRIVFDTLLQRERLGSTGIGSGVAIPHGKLHEIDRIHGMAVKLEAPIDFDADDEQPVDTVFLLLAPETAGADHLKALARISRLVRQPEFLDKIRSARSADALYDVLTGAEARDAA